MPKDILKSIRNILSYEISWYKEHKHDEDYVYDECIHKFHELTRGECLDILDFLSQEEES